MDGINWKNTFKTTFFTLDEKIIECNYGLAIRQTITKISWNYISP